MPLRVRQNDNAFSLLELIIVVAIISILATIAMPNYMDAITRSKVAKFKGDAHTIDTALTSYAVDRQILPYAEAYPVGSPCSTGPNYQPPSAAQGYLPRSLTTPASYLGKLPVDPFKNNEDAGPCYPERRTYLYSNDYQNGPYYRYYYVSNLYAQITGAVTTNAERPSNAIYMVDSVGPDGDRDHGPNGGGFPQDPIARPYDPTNGTLSSGDVYYFGPSIGLVD